MQERWKGSRLGFLPVGPLHSLQPLLQPQVVAEAPLRARECALRVSGQAAVLGGLGEPMQRPELWEALHLVPVFSALPV